MNPHSPGPPIESLLVYSTGEVIGDGVIKLPWIAALRRACPQARLTWCAASGESVYATSLAALARPLIDEIIDEPRLVVAHPSPLGPPPFGGRRFDLVIDTQGDWRQTLAVRRAARRRFVSAAGGFVFSDRRWRGPRPQSMGERVGGLFSLAAERALAPVDLWRDDVPALARAARMLPAGPRYLGLAVGAGGREKRWPLERFLILAERQAALGLTPVFLLGPREADEAASIRRRLPHALIPDTLATGTDLISGPRLVVALAGRMVAAVANDAGPGHMLAAGGAPLVSLQRTPRTARKFRPAASRLALLTARDGDMTTIGLPEVEAALAGLIQDRPGLAESAAKALRAG